MDGIMDGLAQGWSCNRPGQNLLPVKTWLSITLLDLRFWNMFRLLLVINFIHWVKIQVIFRSVCAIVTILHIFYLQAQPSTADVWVYLH